MSLTVPTIRKFVEEVKVYQKRQQNYKDDVKKKVTRQVIVTLHLVTVNMEP